MDLLLQSFVDLVAFWPLFYVTIGVGAGIIFGAIPGLNGGILLALVLPLTFNMDTTHSIVLLVSIYTGGVSGGLISGTLIGVPGSPAALMTTFDAFPMARKGHPARALSLGIVASFVGGLISWLFLAFLSPPLTRIALKFSEFEIFSMVMMGIVLIGSVSAGSLAKGLFSGALGMLIATVGWDEVTGESRMTMGFQDLAVGFELLPVFLGLFAVTQMLSDVQDVDKPRDLIHTTFAEVMKSIGGMKTHIGNYIRSAIIGTWIGILPGIGASAGSIIAYTAAKKASKKPEDFGQGSEEGIVASETANNATIGGALIPMITLGIPGSVADVILLAALILHSVVPGPLLMLNNPDVFYGIISSALLANIIMFVIMISTAAYIGRIIDIHQMFLIPIVLFLCVMGIFLVSSNPFNLFVLLGFGVLGLVLKFFGIPTAPFVIGYILEPVAEESLRIGLMLSDGSFAPLFTRPLSAVFLAIAFGFLVWSPLKNSLRAHKLRRESVGS
ncbi:tripartite tricarboxylate transporter permease [Pararhizobium sp. IMCC21322]|uniref:tripartite tricarboxylate transporter permease n=1 Tax=Pararhizobium sp. IMCC21322 TaxID=3067903 RepID=UPI002740A4CD|nr:tripartite tricarboxylate transporter permease [Pararhizobium sp. IMCC21322]